jgi:DNA ligase-associated metallophosphoesterase
LRPGHPDPAVKAEEVVVAGERALCDQYGALYFPDLALLIVSDLHLEKGAAHARRGALIPPYDTVATLNRLQTILTHYAPRMVISLGDSFHDGMGAALMPGLLKDQLIEMTAGRDWFWITGNHDPDAPEGLPGDTVREIAVGNLIFRHEPSTKPVAGEIAGHLHPCARIVRRGRSVRRRCFACDGLRMIMPAFGAYTGSLNVLDRAYAGMFSWESFMAYMLGARRIYRIAGSLLRPG